VPTLASGTKVIEAPLPHDFDYLRYRHSAQVSHAPHMLQTVHSVRKLS
jgi:hypothetical protein